MEKGKIKWFNPSKNFGFIEREDNPDLFFHGSDVIGKKVMKEGDEVEFEIGFGKKGQKAIDVERLNSETF